MPSMTFERAQQLEATAKKALDALGENADGAKKRFATKKLRRAQRLRRRLGKGMPAPAAEAAPAAAEEAPAEESAE